MSPWWLRPTAEGAADDERDEPSPPAPDAAPHEAEPTIPQAASASAERPIPPIEPYRPVEAHRPAEARTDEWPSPEALAAPAAPPFAAAAEPL
ncbi:MAG TPA: dihydrolipoamide succinyltransferase, partial [Thermoanaerobaculia bacterium]|nr:dihydrolipoamide succinyltransferase [Thermoanaerobaculia bacterium]